MKKYLVILFVIIGMTAVAQEKEADKPEFDYTLSCKKAKIFPDINVMVCLGDVNFQSDILVIQKADKLIFDQNNQEIFVTGLDEFTFDGAIEISTGNNNESVRYKLGEKIAYVE